MMGLRKRRQNQTTAAQREADRTEPAVRRSESPGEKHVTSDAPLSERPGSAILQAVAQLSCWLGLWMMESLGAVGACLRRWLREKPKAYIARCGSAVWRGLKKAGVWITHELIDPVLLLAKACGNVRRHVAAAFRQGFWTGVAGLGASLLYLLTQLFRALLHVLNYAAPVVAVYLLMTTVNYFANVDYALAVKYDGYSVGYVSDMDVYDAAEDMLRQRLSMITLPEDELNVGSTTYSVVFVPEDDLSTAFGLCDRMIEKSTSDLVTASGVYVDGVFLGAITNGAELREYLQAKLDAAVDQTLKTLEPESAEDEEDEDAAVADTETLELTRENLTADFVRNIVVEDGLYPKEGLIDATGIRQQFDSVVSGEVTYTVAQGDSPWTVAGSHGLTLEEFLALNPGADEDFMVGQQVVISKEVPYLQVELAATVQYTEPVPFTVEKVESSDNYVGYAKTVKEGEEGEELVVASVKLLNGQEVSRDILSRNVVKEPVAEQVMVGTKETGYATYQAVSTGRASATKATGSFMWPVDGGYTSCGFYGYWNHGGQDIAASAGTNIRASDAGLVEISTTNYAIGYGKYIVINHGGGVKTLYAHCSALYVSAGDYVGKGDVIAAVGRTGNATGNHCHFEIRLNGVRVDPAKYIGSSYWR